MHNLRTVMQFEIVRTLKKKSFWVMCLAFPVMVMVIFGIIFFSNKATEQAVKDAQKQKFSMLLFDESGLVDQSMASQLGAKTIADEKTGVDQVRSGAVDAFFYYPKDLSRESVQIYSKDFGMFDNGRYGAVAKTLLDESVSRTVNASQRVVLGDQVNYHTTSYKDGEVYDGVKQLIAPGVFLILFYILIAMFGNQMLNSTIEEKENRVIEMLLTTVESRTLILGKIVALVILGIIQTIVILVPVILIYVYFGDKLSLPNFDLTNLPLNPQRIGVALAIFMASFLLFTGLLVTIGAATPTAKEAGGFFGVVMMLIFGPLYAAPLFISAPDSPLVQFLSYFPFTAPIPLLLRNAVGNLEAWQALLALVILTITAIFVLNIAVRVFRYGALEYNRKLSLREIFGRS